MVHITQERPGSSLSLFGVRRHGGTEQYRNECLAEGHVLRALQEPTDIGGSKVTRERPKLLKGRGINAKLNLKITR